MDRIDASQIFRMLESGYALPPLSVIALRLLEVASDEDASNDANCNDYRARSFSDRATPESF